MRVQPLSGRGGSNMFADGPAPRAMEARLNRASEAARPGSSVGGTHGHRVRTADRQQDPQEQPYEVETSPQSLERINVPTMRGSSEVRRRRSVPAGGRRGCSCWITSWPSEALPTRAGAAVAFRPCRSAPFGCTRNSPTSGCRARSGPCGSGQAASPPTLHDSQLVL